MKQTVNKSDFRDAFQRMDRKDQFSYDALGALFDWYESLDEDCGTETELDVIAICCDWCEYGSMDAVQEDYPDIKDLDSYGEKLDYLRDRTTVIEVSNALIIQGF